jgi:catechol 2,3-dioxygenase-like lactoylglutathione lyase family enzyme
MAKIISGIQQIGIGVPDVQSVWKWYRKFFGNDVRIFEEAAEAPLMINYTGNKVQSRTATLAISLEGGGGFEIWQFTSRKTEKPSFQVQVGDLGIFITRIKSKDVKATYNFYKREGVQILGELSQTPSGNWHFYFKDPNDNIFEIVEGREWFASTKALCGGVDGVVMGVSNIEKSRKLYSDILGYDKVIYDKTGVFDDLKGLPGGDQEIRRVLLAHSQPRKGPFSRLLGSSQIELFQLSNGNGRKIFSNRYWGDWGFIHLCFDVKDMESLRKECEEAGFPFTVDSKNTFDMGEAGGQFSYIEDPDGALIEFVETHKIPVIKKIGWYLNLKNRSQEKPLPDWILKALRFNRVKG